MDKYYFLICFIGMFMNVCRLQRSVLIYIHQNMIGSEQRYHVSVEMNTKRFPVSIEISEIVMRIQVDYK